MTYRDDNAWLEAKNAQLEQKLSEAEARIAKLSGEGPSPPAPSPDESVVLAGPSRMHASHDLDYEITTEGYETIATVPSSSLAYSQAGRTSSSGASQRTEFSQKRGMGGMLAHSESNSIHSSPNKRTKPSPSGPAAPTT